MFGNLRKNMAHVEICSLPPAARHVMCENGRFSSFIYQTQCFFVIAFNHGFNAVVVLAHDQRHIMSESVMLAKYLSRQGSWF